MKILFVMPYLPSPPRTGGQRRMHGLLRELARDHEISVLSLFDAREDQTESVRETSAYSRRVVTVPGVRRFAAGTVKRGLQVASMLTPWSFEAICWREPAFQRAFDRVIEQDPFDLVQFEFAQMAVYRRPRARRWRSVLDEHNIEYDVVRRTAEADVGPVRRAYSAVDWRKLRREERTAWRGFDGCVVTSARDRDLLLREEPRTRTAVVPNGVDVESFRPRDDAEGSDETVLFFGALNYHPNVEGVTFFLREVWPRIKSLRPGARFRIVGPHPPPGIARWPDPSVEVAGFVEDVRAEIARARVVVAPLRIGGGTRLKVLEAMALAKATVSTTLGAEGIDVTDGQDIVLADSPEAFARSVATLLADDGKRRRIGEAARRLAVERYSWRAAADRLLAFYDELNARGSAADPT